MHKKITTIFFSSQNKISTTLCLKKAHQFWEAVFLSKQQWTAKTRQTSQQVYKANTS